MVVLNSAFGYSYFSCSLSDRAPKAATAKVQLCNPKYVPLTLGQYVEKHKFINE